MVEFPAQLFRVFIRMTTFKQNTGIKQKKILRQVPRFASYGPDFYLGHLKHGIVVSYSRLQAKKVFSCSVI